MLRQLRPYLLSRADLIDFYHRNILKAVRERYLPSEEQQRQAHMRLADYFHGQDYWLESLEEQQKRAKTLPPTPRPANIRKVDELPWQLLQAADWQRSEQLLTDLAFLEAKAEAGMVFDLAADVSAAIGGMPADRPLFRILRLLDEALHRDIHFIARHAHDYPQGLFQCLWNIGWWYDTPHAAAHYDLSRRTSKAPLPWDLPSDGRLATLLQRWREEKDRTMPGFPWLRSLRPPAVLLGTAQKAVLRGHYGGVSSVALSGDGRHIVSGSGDNAVRIWDAMSGQELLCLRGHENVVNSVIVSADGRRIVSGSIDKTVRIWEFTSGQELRCLRGHEAWVRSVALSGDGRRIVSGSHDKTVRVWDATNGQELLCLRGHWSQVDSVAMSGDGQRIVSGSEDNTVRVWDGTSGQELLCLRGHENGVTCVAVSGDGRRIVSKYRDGTRVWDGQTGECLQIHKGGAEMEALTFVTYALRRTSEAELEALAQGVQQFPFCALARTLETAILEARSQRPFACLAENLDPIAMCPSGRAWTCGLGSYVYIIALEGNAAPTS